MLPYDKNHPDFSIKKLETDILAPFEFEVNGKKQSIIFKGRADRIDSLTSGMQRIVDYKTGSNNSKFKGLNKLFYGEAGDRVSDVVNTLIYTMIWHRTEGVDVQPALYYLRDMHDKKYSPLLKVSYKENTTKISYNIERYSDVAEEFEGYLSEILSELFDPNKPFCQAKDQNACKYCDYATICGKKK